MEFLIKQKKRSAVEKEDPDNLSKIEIPHFVNDIINSEVRSGSWTLMHRFNKLFDILNSIDIHDSDPVSYLYIWLRYSFTRQLD